LAFSQQPGIDPMWEPLVVMRATERVAPLALRQLCAARTRQADVANRRAA
jgi:hypothetical protein